MLNIYDDMLNSGKYQDAMSWLQKIPKGEYVLSDFKKKLFAKLGMNREVEMLCRKSFFPCPSPETLAELLKAVGKDKRQTVIAEAMEKFSGEEYFSTERLNFMLMHGDAEAASAYVIPRWRKVYGGSDAALNQLWPVMKRKGAPLAATIILRALLDSILERKKAKAYYYARNTGTNWKYSRQPFRTGSTFHPIRIIQIKYEATTREYSP